MTTQDIYFWTQMGLQILIGGGVIAGIYRYFGVLKRLIEGQEKTIATQAEQMKALKTTIEAQAEQMKAQSTMLQDLERFNKMMQQAFDFRDQAYKEQVERNATTYQRERLAEWYAAVRREDFKRQQFATSEAYATLKHHLPEALQQELDQSRNPWIILVPSGTGIDPIQTRLLEEIARVEREWGLI